MPDDLVQSERVRALAADSSVSDEQVVSAFDRLLHSYNADSAASTLLGVACTVAHFRSHLLERVLRRGVNALVSMGVENNDQFWEYSRFHVDRDAKREAKYGRDFDPAALDYFARFLPLHSTLIARLIREEFQANTGLDEWLSRFGLRPGQDQLAEVRETLAKETAAETQHQGSSDTDLMKLCCVQIFNVGTPSDALLVWRAKTASMDADGSIDIQLLCGQGLEPTKAYLAGLGTEESKAALKRLAACEEAGDFKEFSVADWANFYARYYEGPGEG